MERFLSTALSSAASVEVSGVTIAAVELFSAAAAQAAPGPWWGSAIIGFIGGVVGAAAALTGTIWSERRKAKHADALQWDKEIVSLVQEFLSSVQKLLDNRPNPLNGESKKTLADFERLCEQEKVNQDVKLGQLELIAPDFVFQAGLNVQNACFDLIQKRYDVLEGGPVRREMTHPEYRELRAEFIRAVRDAIRR